MRTDLPKSWYILVDEYNKDILTKWRFGDTSSIKLKPGYITGMYDWKTSISKEYDWDEKPGKKYGPKITFEEFKTLVLGEYINTEPNYEIY